jgi:hypothetical protein
MKQRFRPHFPGFLRFHACWLRPLAVALSVPRFWIQKQSGVRCYGEVVVRNQIDRFSRDLNVALRITS